MTYCYDDDYNYYYSIYSAEAQSRRPIISLNQQNNDHNAALLGVKCVQNADRVRPVGESLMLLLFRGNSANSSAMRAGGGARFMLCTTPVTQLTARCVSVRRLAETSRMRPLCGAVTRTVATCKFCAGDNTTYVGKMSRKVIFIKLVTVVSRYYDELKLFVG